MLSHTVHRKPTHTNCYLNYHSFHHPRIKSSVYKAFIHQACSICSTQHLDGKFKHLKKVLQQNGFPADKITEEDHKPNKSKQEYMFTVILLYTGPVPHKIERILSKEDIKVYHNTSNKFFQQLFTHKDKTEKSQHPRVYHIPYECRLAYIGETRCTIMTCKKEHYRCCIKGQTEKSSIRKHTWEMGHRMGQNHSSEQP